MFCAIKNGSAHLAVTIQPHFKKCQACMDWALKRGFDVDKTFMEAYA